MRDARSQRVSHGLNRDLREKVESSRVGENKVNEKISLSVHHLCTEHHEAEESENDQSC